MNNETTSFPAAMRGLERHRSPVGALSIGSLVLALLAWLVWFTRAELEVHAVSRRAELTVRIEPHPVQAAVEAPVVAVLVELGQTVERGDVLVRLDPRHTEGELGELRALAFAHEHELAQLARRNAEQRGALVSEADTRQASGEEAEARLGEAREAHALAVADAARVAVLHRQGLVSEAELARARLAEVSRRAELTVAEAARARASSQGRTAEADRRSDLARAFQERDALAGRLAQIRAGIEHLEGERELFDLRAPIAGRVATLDAIRVGSVVASGDTLATVVPDGQLEIEAQFDPGEALGRVRPGQQAWLRLDGFPWTRHGAIRAAVETVAPESADDLVTVKLAILDVPYGIRLEHGMPGRVEVAVETATPAERVLRAAAGRSRTSPAKSSA